MKIKSEIVWNRYLKLMEHARAHPPTGYSENHHVVPRALGGTDVDSNLVRLSARQHFIAHWMLWKATGHRSMASAFVMMSNRLESKRGRSYAVAKEQHAISMSEKFTGVSYMTEEARKAMSERWKGKPKSDAQRAAIGASNSVSQVGKKASEDTKAKMRESRAGRVWSDEVKEKMRISALNKPDLTCDHCGKSCKAHAFKRWHGDNCKSKIS